MFLLTLAYSGPPWFRFIAGLALFFGLFGLVLLVTWLFIWSLGLRNPRMNPSQTDHDSAPAEQEANSSRQDGAECRATFKQRDDRRESRDAAEQPHAADNAQDS